MIWILEPEQIRFPTYLEALEEKYGTDRTRVFTKVEDLIRMWFDPSAPRPSLLILENHVPTHNVMEGLIADFDNTAGYGTRTGLAIAQGIRNEDHTIPVIIYSITVSQDIDLWAKRWAQQPSFKRLDTTNNHSWTPSNSTTILFSPETQAHHGLLPTIALKRRWVFFFQQKTPGETLKFIVVYSAGLEPTTLSSAS
ncbi:hypothetical protein HQ487_04210 [Candidatus Uhrbacteria bacterium]|nr:hypothetical protein [Candidatus Uhrbacteria bacterium]